MTTARFAGLARAGVPNGTREGASPFLLALPSSSVGARRSGTDAMDAALANPCAGRGNMRLDVHLCTGVQYASDA